MAGSVVETVSDKDSVIGVLRSTSQLGDGPEHKQLQIRDRIEHASVADVEEGHGDHDPFDGMHGEAAEVAVLEDGEASAIWCDESTEDEEQDVVSSTPAKRQHV